MKKHIEIAKHVSSNIDANNKDFLSDNNYYYIFEKLYSISTDYKVVNTLTCAIIYSYSNSSK